jgi:hypothetical protein
MTNIWILQRRLRNLAKQKKKSKEERGIKRFDTQASSIKEKIRLLKESKGKGAKKK